MAAWVAPAIAAAAQLGSSLYDSITSRNQAKQNIDRTHKHNLELAEYSYGKDLEMWNRMNLYNTPAAQMERLKAAGLNPKLVYGAGNVAGNVSGKAPEYNAPTMDYRGIPHIKAPDLGGIVQGFQSTRLQEQRIANERAREANILGDTTLKLIGAEGKSIDNKTKDHLLGLQVKYLEEAQKAGIEKTQSEISLNQKKLVELGEIIGTKKAERAIKELEQKGYESITPADRYIIDRVLETIQVPLVPQLYCVRSSLFQVLFLYYQAF